MSCVILCHLEMSHTWLISLSDVENTWRVYGLLRGLMSGVAPLCLVAGLSLDHSDLPAITACVHASSTHITVSRIAMMLQL